MYILISNCQDLEGENESEMNKIISKIFEELSLSTTKAEKDIGITKVVFQKWNKQKS